MLLREARAIRETSSAGSGGRPGAADGTEDLVLLIGLPGSGKTTFYRTRFTSTHVHLSKDLWPNARRKEERLRRLLAAALAEGRSVVVDNTNVTRAQRAPLVTIGHAHGARVVGYVLDSSLAECLARNARRTGKARVPDVAIYAAARRLEPPRPDEGFDELFRVRTAGPHGFEITPWRERCGRS